MTGKIIPPTTDATLLKGSDTRYDNHHDASMRLAGTIIRALDDPYFVRDVSGTSLLLWDGLSDSIQMIDANDTRVDISSPPLGFVNLKDHPVYLMRMPRRSQRQGVELGALAAFLASSKEQMWHMDSGTHEIQQVLKAMRNEYPTLYDASITKAGAAVSRAWALAHIHKDSALRLVYHRRLPVAIYIPKERRFAFQKGELTQFRQTSLNNVLAKQGYGDFHVAEYS